MIAQQVPLLPVYVAGCKEFIALAGPTFSLRLWCVIELFTLLSIQGIDPSNERKLTLLPFGPPPFADGPFRVSNAKCADREMENLVMGIVERAYPSIEEFEALIAEALVIEKPPAPAEKGADDKTGLQVV